MPSRTRNSVSGWNWLINSIPLMYCFHRLMVNSSGTSSPRPAYSQNLRPISLCRSSERKMSPVALWWKPGMFPMIFPCVPLPLPGAPKSRMVR